MFLVSGDTLIYPLQKCEGKKGVHRTSFFGTEVFLIIPLSKFVFINNYFKTNYFNDVYNLAASFILTYNILVDQI